MSIKKEQSLINTRLYRIWASMKNRCNCSTSTAYKHYGARGITVCEEWQRNFMNFYNWAINNGYKDNLTIDRIDVNGNYEPSNCRWVDMKIQQRNRRNNKLITYENETHCISEWAEILNISVGCLYTRITQSNWNLEKIFTMPSWQDKNYITYKGETKSIIEWAYLLKIPYKKLYRRIHKLKWEVKRAFTTP